MPKITKIVNGEYIGGDKYKITDAGGGKSKVEFSPDNVIKAGTQVGSEILNEVQNNCLYEVIGTKVTEGQEEIYNCNLEGLDTFTFESLILLVSFNLSNTKNDPFLRIGGIKYQLKSKGENIPIGNISNNQKSIVVIIKSSGLANFVDDNYVLTQATPTVIGGVKSVVNDLVTASTDRPLSSGMGKKLKDDAYLNESIIIGDTQKNVDTLIVAGQYQCGANNGPYHLSYIDAKNMFGPHNRQIHHDWEKGIQWRDRYDGDFTGVPWVTILDTDNINIKYCPFPVYGIVMFDNPNINPATIWPGTTWGRIASERNIRGSNAGDAAGSTGGSDTVIISQPNLPNINLTAPDHTHTIPNHAHSLIAASGGNLGDLPYEIDKLFTPSFNNDNKRVKMEADGGGSNTSGASSRIIPLGGSDTPLNVTNAYYKLHVWKRLT